MRAKMLSFLNNLSIKTRMLLSVALFLGTLGYSMYSAHTSIGANITFADQEKKGDFYQRPLANLLHTAGQLRLDLAKARTGDVNKESIKEKIAVINKDMAALKTVQDQIGEDLQFTEEGLKSRGRENLKYENVLNRWNGLAEGIIKDEKAAQNEQTMADFIADVRGMIAHSGDTSNLILDPDLDSYYLMDITLLALPQTIDRLGAIGNTLIPKLDNLTPDDRTETAVMAQMLAEADVARIGADVDTSTKEDSNFYGVSESFQNEIPKLRASYDEKNKVLIGLLKDIAAGKAVASRDLVGAIGQAQEQAYAFLTKGYDELDKLLDYRIASYRGQQAYSVFYSMIGIIISMLFFMLVVRTVTKPLIELTGVMRALADNNLNIHVAYAESRSEIGRIANSIQVFKDNGLKMAAMKDEQARKDRETAEEKKRMMTDLASRFETSVGNIVQAVASASTELQGSASSLSNVSQHTSQKAGTVAAASEETSTNVQVVASSAEELTSSINEISSRVQESTNMISNAVNQINTTNETVKKLAESSSKIGEVVKLINEIAAQTNLLALNATIEAARAGEAGKGFAVVASEVKNLAGETAKATEEISSSIASMQEVTGSAVEAMQTIARTIEKINEVSGSIAAAVTQQSAATREIARNIQQVSTSTTEVSSNITEVTKAADETQHGSSEVLQAAGELSVQSEKLKREVSQFLLNVRAS